MFTTLFQFYQYYSGVSDVHIFKIFLRIIFYFIVFWQVDEFTGANQAKLRELVEKYK